MPEFVIEVFPVDYGAPELKNLYKKFLMRGLTIAAALHFAAIGVYWGSMYLTREDEPIATVRILKYSEMGPPPSITNSQTTPAIAVSTPAVKPSVGIPVAVPDAEVNPEQTIASQEELSRSVAPEGESSGGGTVIEQDIKVDEEPGDFVPVEKYPEAVKIVHPKYPELAMRAGVEGVVYVKAWVDREGKVRKTLIVKTDAEILNQAAMDAVQQWVFTPAIMNNGPVSVWVTIPVHFKLQGG